ncbi:MAG: hypothetical protein JOY92_01810, partial [Verrucomicrobia bacterium]|nr:hypothetical protein [Verrucomicrobiota bacterium]
TVVSKGVQAAETVVVEGQLALANGMKVNPAPYKPTGPGASPPGGGPNLTENSPDTVPDQRPKPSPPQVQSAL